MKLWKIWWNLFYLKHTDICAWSGNSEVISKLLNPLIVWFHQWGTDKWKDQPCPPRLTHLVHHLKGICMQVDVGALVYQRGMLSWNSKERISVNSFTMDHKITCLVSVSSKWDLKFPNTYHRSNCKNWQHRVN